MSAGKYNIFIEQGATFRMNLVWKDATRMPMDLTGYIARMQVRQSYASCEAFMTLTTDNKSVVLGGAQGTINIVGSANQTSGIPIRSGVYDIELESPNGVVTRLLEGKATISPEVTR